MVPSIATNASGGYTFIVLRIRTRYVNDGTGGIWGSNLSFSDLPYWRERPEKKRRSAIAIPPQPPPVALTLCTSPVLETLCQIALARTPVRRRRHARQSVPVRSRRRTRVWER